MMGKQKSNLEVNSAKIGVTWLVLLGWCLGGWCAEGAMSQDMYQVGKSLAQIVANWASFYVAWFGGIGVLVFRIYVLMFGISQKEVCRLHS